MNVTLIFFFFFDYIFTKYCFLLYPMRSMGESIGIGLEASSTSKGPQAKTTDPWTQLKSHIVGFNQVEFQHMTVLRKMQWGLVQRPKSAIFTLFHLLRADRWMDGWMDVIVFFVHDFFHTVAPVELKLKTYHQFNKMKR